MCPLFGEVALVGEWVLKLGRGDVSVFGWMTGWLWVLSIYLTLGCSEWLSTSCLWLTIVVWKKWEEFASDRRVGV